MVELVYTRPYERSSGAVMTDAERAAAEDEIAADPMAWPLIPGSGGLRKARARRAGKGKSGGARVIYYYVAADGRVILLFVYAKSEREDLTQRQLKLLRDLASQLIE